MPYTQRTFDPATDLAPALALADASSLGLPHVADWPYRFASWGLDDPHNAQVWLDDNARIIGWVVMQTPFWAIDCIAHPDAPLALYGAMLDWAKQRAVAMQQHGTGRPMWFVSIAERYRAHQQALEEHGFENISNAAIDPWSKVLLELADTPSIPALLPRGLSVRSLNPHTEIEKYVALHREVFESENMTIPWRTRTTQAADYNNALDLVVASDDGQLHGFCVTWLRRLVTGEIVGQIEPLGVRQDMRGQGLSRHLLTEAIHRLQALGATRIVVETDQQRSDAIAAYQAIGFRVVHEVAVYKLGVEVPPGKATNP